MQDPEWFLCALQLVGGTPVGTHQGDSAMALKIVAYLKMYTADVHFAQLANFYQDQDRFLLGIQKAQKKIKEEYHLVGLTQEANHRMVKDILKIWRDKGPKVQLPLFWEHVCNEVASVINKSNSKYDHLVSMYKTFEDAFKKWHTSFAGFQASVNVDLNSMRPMAALAIMPDSASIPSTKAQQPPRTNSSTVVGGAAPRAIPAPPAPARVVDLSQPSGDPCWGCGRSDGHARNSCTHQKHKNFNFGHTSWAESDFGKEFKGFKHDVLPMSHKVTLQSLRAARNAAAGITVVATNTATEPNFSTGEFFSLNSLSDMANNVEIDFLIPGFLSLSLRGKAVEAQRGNQVSSILVLMDTGAICDRDIVGAHVMRSFADSLGDICSPCLNEKFCSPKL
jgi:hypothetical protein